jgi:hypothetical protein
MWFLQGLVWAMLISASAHAQVYNQFQPGGDLAGTGSTWNNQVITPGAVTLAKQAALIADSFNCNTSNSAATPQACNPLAAANLIGAQIAAQAAISLTTGGDHAYGTYTSTDGVALTNGEVVFVYQGGVGQTCGTGTNSSGTGGALSASAGICNGLWLVNTGAPWTRPINFPAGYVIAQNCNLTVFIEYGTHLIGHTYRISTASAITINTSQLPVTDATLGFASTTIRGTVTVTEITGTQVPVWQGNLPTAFGDCASYFDAGAGLADLGNASVQIAGPCIVGDANGDIYALNNSSAILNVTGTGCSSAANSTNNSGAIIAAGIDTCFVTFGGAGFPTAPFCTLTPYSTLVLPFISTPPTTAGFGAKTAAAGTFSYQCM